MKKSSNKGFSLVELIIVIVIIAIIIALLAPQFLKQVEKSREARDLQDIDEYKVAVETMVLDDAVPVEGVTLTVNPETGYVESNIESDVVLKRYGLEKKFALASKQWSGFVWHFDTSDYCWKLEDAEGHVITEEEAEGAVYFTPLGKNRQ